ncbi:MAG TPA: FG-GAP and VCBS repeat-containing protein [Chitinophagaceae bacterium]|nr:FG-GAP and VCBS repeat-containing protein [Chitinophagaceae bacterium]
MKTGTNKMVSTGVKTNLKRKLLISLGVVTILSATAWLIYGHKNASSSAAGNPQGKALASQYCASCHSLPDPSLLDKENWKKLLPEMGVSLGIESKGIHVPDEDKSLYPTTPSMNGEEWQSILDFYESAAPLSLPLQNREKPPAGPVPFFNALIPPENTFRPNTMVTCARIDNSVQPARLFIYDAFSHQLYLFNRSGLQDSLYCEDVIVDIRFYKNEIFACTIGKELTIGTSRNKMGTIFPLVVNKDNKLEKKPALFQNLGRPVELIPTDLNGDQRTDFLVCEFGGIQGSLSWLQNKGGGQFQKNIIRNAPGSVHIEMRPNKANKGMDLWVLFAQGREGIFHFLNKGNGKFDVKQVLDFPSTYGSTSFQMIDLDKDGFEDIVYSCGDNGDITGILKPYHGVYVFLNDGNNRFKQNYFYPMHGCYKVIAKDFRNSGQIDLAAIAYFTDSDYPEPFVYLKNEGHLRFTPYNPPEVMNFRSALTMDAGDFNNDGRPDLLIGNALTEKGGNNKGSPFAILANGGTR